MYSGICSTKCDPCNVLQLYRAVLLYSYTCNLQHQLINEKNFSRKTVHGDVHVYKWIVPPS